jgi:hypothetical protein
MTTDVVILVAYYVVALVAVVAWVYRDHATTKRRVADGVRKADRLAGAFVNRVSLLVAVVAGAGAALTLTLLLHPRLETSVVAYISGAAAVLTLALLETGLRLPRAFGVDPLPELRPRVASSRPAGAEQPRETSHD